MHAGETLFVFALVGVTALDVQIEIALLTEATQAVFAKIRSLTTVDHLMCL